MRTGISHCNAGKADQRIKNDRLYFSESYGILINYILLYARGEKEEEDQIMTSEWCDLMCKIQ